MTKTIAIVILIISIILLAGGLLFACAASRNTTRLLLSAGLLIIGAGLAAWSGISLRRLRQLDPENLSDEITAMAERSGHAEVTLSQVVSGLGVPDEAAQKALDLLESKGQAARELRTDGWVYMFPGLKESRVIRKCAHCGREYSVKTPIYECTNCGGKVELVKV